MRIDQMHYNFRLEIDRVDSNDRPGLMPWEIDEYLNKAIIKFIKLRFNYSDTIKQGFETHLTRVVQLGPLHVISPETQPPVVPINLGNGKYEIRLNALGSNINGQFFRYLFLTKLRVKIKKGDCFQTIDATPFQTDDYKTKFTDASWTWKRVLYREAKSNFVNLPVTPSPPVNADSRDYTASLITGSGSNARYNNDELKSLYIDTTDKNGVQQFEVVEAYPSYIRYPNRVFIGGYDHIDGHSNSTSAPIHCDIEDAYHDEIIRLAVALAKGDLENQVGIQISNQRILDDYQL